MKHTLVVKYIGDDKETLLPFVDIDKDSTNGWLIIIDSNGKTTYVNTNNCKYFYFREEEKK